MEKQIDVSDGGSVCSVNLTINFNNGESAKSERKNQANKTGTNSAQDTTENGVQSKARKNVSQNMSSDNTTASDALKQKFLKHKKDVKYYKMTGKPKGTVIIINNEFFVNADDRRRGSRVDVENLMKAFELLGPCVSFRIDSNLSFFEMEKMLKWHASSETKPSFLAVVIMSHGELGHKKRDWGYDDLIICSDEKRMTVKKVVDIFGVRNLKGIPKLFFFQMCRGRQTKAAMFQEVKHADSIDGDSIDHDSKDLEALKDKISCELRDLLKEIMPKGHLIETINTDLVKIIGDTVEKATAKNDEDQGDKTSTPTGSDMIDAAAIDYLTDNMLISFSTSEGFGSMRTRNGSWFIQAICDNIEKKVLEGDDVNVVELMKQVHVDVHKRRSKKYQELVIACETAVSLSKKLCFFPGLS